LPKVRALELDEAYQLSKNSICRGCYSKRMEVRRLVNGIRERGGLTEFSPPEEVQKKFDEEQAQIPRPGRGAQICGLTSEEGSKLNGSLCKLMQREDTGRWTVQLVPGDTKALKEENLTCSPEIDSKYRIAYLEWATKNKEAALVAAARDPDARPLGKHTSWPKVPGIHPGAVVRLQGLATIQLNGRKGRCISYDPHTERWKVDLGDEHKSIKYTNLAPCREKPPTRQSAEEEKRQLGVVDDKKMRETDPNMDAREKFAQNYGWNG